MKKNATHIKKLAAEILFVAAITALNRCLEQKENAFVKRDNDEKTLNRKLTLVSLAYHAIGIFYNE